MPPWIRFQDISPRQRIIAIKHPQPSPLVSIICRTMDRPSLSDTLASACAQSWSNTEILLVDATGKGLASSITDDLNPACRLISTGEPLDRPRAANAGLDAASGDYLLFLDDDDWIAPEHIETLVNALGEHPGYDLVYANVRVTRPDGSPTDKIFDHAYDPVLLRRDNYIPIHAVLFSRRLLGAGCRFDESLSIYEDWDFWLQCSAHTDFLHIDAETAFYRQGGASETALINEQSKYDGETIQGKARIALFNKWLPSWSASDLNYLLGTMDNSQALQKLELQIEQSKAYTGKLESDINAIREELRLAHLTNMELHGNLHLMTEQRNRLIDERNNLATRQEQLLAAIESVYQSSSWRMTRPYRWLGHHIKRMTGRQDQ
jgi:glycosyltransferase involved in cell wall biosynthesis